MEEIKDKESEYLVRPGDYSIYELDKTNNCYRSYKEITYSDGTRQNAQENHTFANLTENYGFFLLRGVKYLSMKRSVISIINSFLGKVALMVMVAPKAAHWKSMNCI